MWFSFFIYTVLTALLPGPNNILALNSVQNVGYKNTRFLLFGIYGGFTFVMLLSAYISKAAVTSFESLLDWLKYFGVIYLLYLAWSVAKSKPLDTNAKKREESDLNKKKDFWKGFVLQLVNVKIIVYGITAFSSFVFPNYEGNKSTFAFALLLAFIGCAATWIWALAGKTLANFLNKNASIVNKVMALLLVYCAVSLFL